MHIATMLVVSLHYTCDGELFLSTFLSALGSSRFDSSLVSFLPLCNSVAFAVHPTAGSSLMAAIYNWHTCYLIVYLSFHIWLWMTVFLFSIFALWTLDIPFQQNRFRLCFFLCFLLCEQLYFFLKCLLLWMISSIFAFVNRLCLLSSIFSFWIVLLNNWRPVFRGCWLDVYSFQCATRLWSKFFSGSSHSSEGS